MLDVDGVLTDGGLFYGPDGEVLKRFDVKDGLGIRLLIAAGVEVAIVSGRDDAALAHRAAELGIAELHMGVADKGRAIRDIQARRGIPPEATAAMADDLPDLPLFAHAALRIAPADAEAEVLTEAHHVTPRPGGHSAVRDAARLILARNATEDAVGP